jgi:hypothetical protein
MKKMTSKITLERVKSDKTRVLTNLMQLRCKQNLNKISKQTKEKNSENMIEKLKKTFKGAKQTVTSAEV